MNIVAVAEDVELVQTLLEGVAIFGSRAARVGVDRLGWNANGVVLS